MGGYYDREDRARGSHRPSAHYDDRAVDAVTSTSTFQDRKLQTYDENEETLAANELRAQKLKEVEERRVKKLRAEILPVIDERCRFARQAERPKTANLLEAIEAADQEDFLQASVIDAFMTRINKNGTGSPMAKAFGVVLGGLKYVADAKALDAVHENSVRSQPCTEVELKEACEPGHFIRAYQLESLQNDGIKLGHPNHVVTPSDPGHHKLYTLAVLFVADGYVYGCKFTSKQKNGYNTLTTRQLLNHRPVFDRRTEYILPPGAPSALITQDMPQCEGSMLCSDICRVKMTHTIYKTSGSWTPESAVQVHELVMTNAYVEMGMRDHWKECLRMDEEKAKQYHSPPSVDCRASRATFHNRTAMASADEMADPPRRSDVGYEYETQYLRADQASDSAEDRVRRRKDLNTCASTHNNRSSGSGGARGASTNGRQQHANSMRAAKPTSSRELFPGKVKSGGWKPPQAGLKTEALARLDTDTRTAYSSTQSYSARPNHSYGGSTLALSNDGEPPTKRQRDSKWRSLY